MSQELKYLLEAGNGPWLIAARKQDLGPTSSRKGILSTTQMSRKQILDMGPPERSDDKTESFSAAKLVMAAIGNGYGNFPNPILWSV